jgi:hypothetical protein
MTRTGRFGEVHICYAGASTPPSNIRSIRMKLFNTVRLSGRAAILAVIMTGALGGVASAAVSQLTLDPTARLSPGRLHAYLTGTITCDPGDNVSLSGQVVEPDSASGYGYTTPVCGTQQAYTIDVSTGGGFPGSAIGVFKPGKASAQVTSSICNLPPFPEPFPFPGCSTMYTDAIIRLQ